MEQGQGLGTVIKKILHRQHDSSQKDVTQITTPTIDSYLTSRTRGVGTHDNPELEIGETITIPLGRFGSMGFTKENYDWRTNRDSQEYNYKIFWDEFETDSSFGEQLHTRPQNERSRIVAGGIQTAFAAGKTVLDLGSGEAIALLEYSKDFPETVFVGVDTGYDRQVKPDLIHPGVQLTKDDWNVLSTIPDKSVDTIISLQGAMRWGINNQGDLINAIDRVAKPGAIFRFDVTFSELKPGSGGNVNGKLLEQLGWEVLDSGIVVKKAA